MKYTLTLEANDPHLKHPLAQWLQMPSDPMEVLIEGTLTVAGQQYPAKGTFKGVKVEHAAWDGETGQVLITWGFEELVFGA